MAGDAATIKIGSNVTGAIAGLVAIRASMKLLDKSVLDIAKSVRTSTKIMTAAFAAVGIAAGIIAYKGIKASLTEFEKYEQSVANAAAVTGTFGEEFITTKNNIKSMARELGKTTVFSATAAASAIYDIASAGYDVTDMIASDMEPMLNLAAGTQSDLTQTTEIVTATLGQYGLGIESAGRVSDVFARTIGSSKATLDKIGLSFKYTGTLAAQFGDSLEDVAAGLAIMYNNGLRGEQAGRALRIAYARLSDPTADVISVLKELGLTIDDVSLETSHMNDILNVLNKSGITVGQTMKLFGVEAGTGVSAAVLNMPLLQQMNDSLELSGSSAKDMAAKGLDTLRGSSTLLHSALADLRIEIGSRVSPYLRNLMMIFRDIVLTITPKVLPAFNKLIEIFRDLQPAINAVKVIAHATKGIIMDFINSLGGSAALIDMFVYSLNTTTSAIAFFLYYIDKHPNIVKFSLAIGSVVIALAFLPPIMTAISGLAWVLTGVLATLNVAFLTSTTTLGFLSTLLAAVGGPITLVIAAVAFLAAAWATNLFGMRDVTKQIVDEIIVLFADLEEPLYKHGENLMDLRNKIRNMFGKESIEYLTWDEKEEKEKMDIFAENFKNKYIAVTNSVKDESINSMFDVDRLGILDEYTGANSEIARRIREVEEATKAATEATMANTIATNANILAKGNYPDISGRSAKSAQSAIDYRRSGAETADRREYTSEGANAARASGELKSGDTYFTIGTITTKSDVDDLDERMQDAQAAV